YSLSFHPATAAPASVNIDNVLEGADGGLDLLDMDVDPSTAGPSAAGPSAAGLSDVPDMSVDLMMPPSALFHKTSSTAAGSQSSKRLRTNTLLDTLETSSYNSNATPKSSYADSHHSSHHSSLPLLPTLVPSSKSPAFKKARVSAYESAQTAAMSSAAKIAAKITPAAAIMNMQGTINRLTDVIEKNTVASEPAPAPVVVPVVTMISRGLAIMRSGDGDLSVAQRAHLLRIFTHSGGENNLTAYVELEDDFEMRREFILGLLASV
ncbi:hypothetical protein DEU56DRAFT_757382, partial [Suillus clintonianus]|uniref:uncharacterized protein n=1 Tax=Suillus clintonianus TaxID=1904413 RepID=UPI001B87D764